MTSTIPVHATLIFERIIPATAERVFAAYTNLVERMQWGAPSDGTALVYEKADFSEGGEDAFLCGPKSNPNIRGTTHYLDIVLNQRIVSSETISMDGLRLCVSLSTFDIRSAGDRTFLKATVQLVSFVGQDMVQGHEQGTNASLDNLLKHLEVETL